jgi:hypothetical protein
MEAPPPVTPAPTGDDTTTPDALLQALALSRQVRLSGLEWRVVLFVFAAPEPVSARAIARRLHGSRGAARAYPHVKAIVRRLIARGLIERTPEGLWFETDPRRWGPRLK